MDYLALLKNCKNSPEVNRQNRQNLSTGGFVSFGSTESADFREGEEGFVSFGSTVFATSEASTFQHDGAALVTLRAAGLSLEVDTDGQLLVSGDPHTIQKRQKYIDANRLDLIEAILERQEAFEERAAIMEHDGGLSREQAEERAAEILDH